MQAVVGGDVCAGGVIELDAAEVDVIVLHKGADLGVRENVPAVPAGTQLIRFASYRSGDGFNFLGEVPHTNDQVVLAVGLDNAVGEISAAADVSEPAAAKEPRLEGSAAKAPVQLDEVVFPATQSDAAAHSNLAGSVLAARVVVLNDLCHIGGTGRDGIGAAIDGGRTGHGQNNAQRDPKGGFLFHVSVTSFCGFLDGLCIFCQKTGGGQEEKCK